MNFVQKGCPQLTPCPKARKARFWTGQKEVSVNDRTPLANSPDWLKAAPMRENLLASWGQSGQKQDPCPSWLNHNAKYKRLLPPYCDFANSVGSIPDSHSHLVSFPVWLERLSRFAEVPHRVDVNALCCGDILRRAMSSIMRWRKGVICLVIGNSRQVDCRTGNPERQEIACERDRRPDHAEERQL